MTPAAARREGLLARLREARTWDLAVVGGGATGLGVALDAAARGFAVVLLESEDFAQGTSSRATKLVHGGVRYLAQGNIGLVREALHERGALLANAPHVAQRLPFVVPGYRFWEPAFYGAGLKVYDALALSQGLGSTEFLSARRTAELLPNVQQHGLVGGIKYWDGQFDDARLAVVLARTAAARGALVLNHVAVTALRREGGKVTGVVARDVAGGETFGDVRARCVVNATGVWVDGITALDHGDDAPAPRQPPPPRVAPSQGVHLVVDRAFMPAGPSGAHALLVPKTDDGRVLFAVPWLGKTVLGTTDTPRADAPLEPSPRADEVAFILREAGRYLARAPTPADVRSVWVGLRPLVKPAAGSDGDTKSISREHTVWVSRSGLVSVTGGKWTTYRAMAEDVLARCMASGLLAQRPAGATAALRLVGAPAVAEAARSLAAPPGEHLYGSEAAALRTLAGATRWLAHDAESGAGILSEAMVRFAVRHEFARDTTDVLARRCRLLFLDAAAAARAAPAVATLVAEETGRDPGLEAFAALAQQYSRLP
jgi:glycerol-3-phosphate dehydrogenase